MGILAHEVGHLEKFHITKRKQSQKKMGNISDMANLSLIAGSLLLKNNHFLVESIVTNQIGIQNYYLSFSRDQEREADFYGIETLKKLNLSKKPLINFLNFLEVRSYKKGFTEEYFKFSTHPIFKDRYKIISNSKNNIEVNFDNDLNQRFNFIKAKIFGYTENNLDSLKENLEEEYKIYAKSIILSKKGELKKSMRLLNNLIKDYPNNKFILETKGDILYSNGYLTEALLFYEKVSTTYPLNNYVKNRIFEIKFAITDINQKKNSFKLFDEYSHLLVLFFNDIDLNNKFHKLAKINGYQDWIDYFSIIERLNKEDLNKDEIAENLLLINKRTSDKVLKKLLNLYKYN